MTTTESKNYKEARRDGLVLIGEWGFSGTNAGGIWSRPEDRDAVRAAYDAIDTDDSGPNALDEVERCGGMFVPDVD